MFDILVKGGFIMYPLLLCSIISMAIFLERLFYFWSIRQNSDELMSDVKLYLKQGKVLDAAQKIGRASCRERV
jgi:biopolymer transport protein ExbB